VGRGLKCVVVRSARALSVVLFLLGATGCAILEPDLPAPDRNQAGELVAESDTNPAALRLGDCASTLAPPGQPDAEVAGESFDIYEVTAVPCEDEHVLEAYALTTLPDGELSAIHGPATWPTSSAQASSRSSSGSRTTNPSSGSAISTPTTKAGRGRTTARFATHSPTPGGSQRLALLPLTLVARRTFLDSSAGRCTSARGRAASSGGSTENAGQHQQSQCGDAEPHRDRAGERNDRGRAVDGQTCCLCPVVVNG
jgi:hypothetical protein